MKAAYITRTGPPDSIIFGDLPTVQPSATECVVRVGAVAVNPIDTYIRSGMVAMPLRFPFVVGCDLAGTVESVGLKVRRLKVGDRVWGTNQGLFGRQGTFAEYATVDEKWLYPTPPTESDAQAAAGALVGITAYLGLFRFARLQTGEVVFVNGGSGGVGSAVIQQAKPGRASPWLLRLLAKKSKKIAAVALANKMARIVWAMMVSGETYRRPAQA